MGAILSGQIVAVIPPRISTPAPEESDALYLLPVVAMLLVAAILVLISQRRRRQTRQARTMYLRKKSFVFLPAGVYRVAQEIAYPSRLREAFRR